MKKIPIRIQPLFWLFALLIGFLNAGTLVGTLIWVVVILLSVLVHELGHALTGLLFKQSVQIELLFFGGVTYRDGPKISRLKEFVLTLNGPLFGFGLSALAYLLLSLWQAPWPFLNYALQVTFVVNLFWSLINLVPVLPLDGGHLLRIFLESFFGPRGTSAALLVSLFLGAMIGIFFLIFGSFVVAFLFFILAFDSFRTWSEFRHSSTLDRDETFQAQFKAAQDAHARGESESALAQFQHLREATGKGLLYEGATEGVAILLSQRGDRQAAYHLLKGIGKRLTPRALLLYHRLACELGDYSAAIAVEREVYELQPGYAVALANAMAHAGRTEVRPTLGWLQRALSDGLPAPSVELGRSEFDPIRHDPAFQRLLASVD